MPRQSNARLRRPNAPPRPVAARLGRARRLSPDDRFFRHLVASMRNGVIVIRRDGTLALINDEGCRIFGISPSPRDIGRPFSEVFRERPQLVRVLSGAFELSTLPNRAELRLKDLDRVVGYTLSQVREDSGVPVGAVLFFKDLTQVEQLEERERLRDRLASLGEMAAGIAHELKNPLAALEVMAGLLRRKVADSPDAQTLLADIMSEAKLANAIVCDMLEFVRPIRLQVERTDLSAVLHQAVMQAQMHQARGNTSVQLDVEAGLPSIEGDHTQLCQVFINLLTNAFEALEGQGRVTLSAVADAGDPAHDQDAPAPVVVVEVADTGPGIPIGLSDRIFNPFFTTKTTGSGLGLPIVRKIVDAHEGRIDVTSGPGQGTRFKVTLPVSSGSSWFK
jgi:PAS domain S-box-containing protein